MSKKVRAEKFLGVLFLVAALLLFGGYWFFLAPLLWRLLDKRWPLVFWVSAFAVWCALMAAATFAFLGYTRRRKKKPERRRKGRKRSGNDPPLDQQDQELVQHQAVQPLTVGPKMSLAFDEDQVPEYRKKKSFEYNFILLQNASLSTAWFIENERDSCAQDYTRAEEETPPAPRLHQTQTREMFFKDLLESGNGTKDTSPEKTVGLREALERCVRTVDSLYIDNEWQSKPEKSHESKV